MTEDTKANPEEVAEQAGDAPEKEKRSKRGLDAVALRQIRSARKLVTEEGPNPEADFMIASANVLALLDLAAAIRSHNGGGDDEGDAEPPTI
jgi:hypothetical protein